MLKEAIGTGATIEEAMENAKLELNAPEDADVQIEVLERPQKKTLGLFGGSPAKVRACYEQAEKAPVSNVVEYLFSIISGMGLDNINITSHETEEEIIYDIGCDEKDHGLLIGRRGETLDAIQYIVRLFSTKASDTHKRISLNVGNYREKRASNLTALANRSAQQVLRNGRSVRLEPMNPYERRIVHTAIQPLEGVESHSVGFDDSRRVVIELKSGAKPSGSRYGGNNQRYGNKKPNNNNYRKDNNSKSNSNGPKNDVSTASRYGRIDTKASEDN